MKSTAHALIEEISNFLDPTKWIVAFSDFLKCKNVTGRGLIMI